jgi:hypothetical protein
MHHIRMSACALVLSLKFAPAVPAFAAAQDYRFELVGKPQPGRGGKSVVSIRLVHVADNKPVPDAVVFESKADMGPAGMATMTAPVKQMPLQGGVYRFEVEPSMTGPWALNLAAKVQGETETIRGSVTAELVK